VDNVEHVRYYTRKALHTVCKPCRDRYIASVLQVAEQLSPDELTQLAPEEIDTIQSWIQETTKHAKET
jgi:hypothetical protein